MRKKNSNISKFFLGILMLPIWIALLLSLLKWVSPSMIEFPNILEILKDFFQSFLDKEVIGAIITTSKYALISTVLSIVIGVVFSFLLNLNKWIWAASEPTIDFLRSIPITFFIPAFAMILGVSSPHIIWILAIIPSSLIILVNVSYGLKQQNKKRLHQYQLLSGKSNRLDIFRKVTIFEVLPYFISGFKVALSYAIVIVTVLEYMNMGNQIGLGRLVSDEMEQLNYVRVYSIIIIVGLIGYLLNLAIDNISKRYQDNLI